MLAFLCDAYDEEVLSEKDTRIVLRLHPALAPFKACVMPLSKQLSKEAEAVFAQLAGDYNCEYDEAGAASVNVIAVRMQLVHRSALQLTLIPRMTAVLRFVNVIRWHRAGLLSVT